LKKLGVVGITVLLICLNLFSQRTENKIDITYIANSGFLIESSGKKILIDALFNKGWNTYLTPADSIVSKILNQQAPISHPDSLPQHNKLVSQVQMQRSG
jgi:hypothetical protein